MIAAVREWLTSVVAVTLLLTVAQTLIPEGNIRKIAAFTGGLALLAALLQPVLRTDLSRLELDLDAYGQAVEERRMELEAAREEELALVIASQTEAYILDKAAWLGLSLSVQVETETGAEGVPLPWAAEIKGAWSEELAAYMERELGIPRERQVWHETES
ncbi:stage III sporulation protein AF [Oscillibacter sp.]|jgi:stage III sporulation protein AF|uniref:stage III sporulation protein AF n=1 Tax=Oscillibacter sp. TaxID=1945593 RepID=UPI002173A847|nr:stage III sporulation protein AF [Oscillibacter sp.]MCI9649009.1 stage III sporulation protein AF [Oscillibacter sp.]